jgi:hypothetical protein
MRINEAVDALCCRQEQAARHLASLLSGHSPSLRTRDPRQ